MLSDIGGDRKKRRTKWVDEVPHARHDAREVWKQLKLTPAKKDNNKKTTHIFFKLYDYTCFHIYPKLKRPSS